MDAPFLYSETDPLRVSAQLVFSIVKTIIEARQEEEFLRVCQERNATVAVDPDFVNLVKTYLFDKRVHTDSQFARKVIASPGGRCPELS